VKPPPEAVAAPTAILSSLVTLSGYLVVTVLREVAHAVIAEARFRTRRAVLRRDMDTYTEDRVA
jgi:hypothetical protein